MTPTCSSSAGTSPARASCRWVSGGRLDRRPRCAASGSSYPPPSPTGCIPRSTCSGSTRSRWTTQKSTGSAATSRISRSSSGVRSRPRSRAGASSSPTGSMTGCAASSRPATMTHSPSMPCSRGSSGSSAPRVRRRPGADLLASLGDITPTPWDTDREYPEEALGQRIAAMVDRVEPGRSACQLPLPALCLTSRYRGGARSGSEPVLHGGRSASFPSAARPSVTRSSGTSRRSACTATSTSRAAPRRSDRPSA